MAFILSPLVGANLEQVDEFPLWPWGEGGVRVTLSDGREAVYGGAFTVRILADSDECSISDQGSVTPIGGTYLSPPVEVPLGYYAWFIQAPAA
jgi:hypothetical protein